MTTSRELIEQHARADPDERAHRHSGSAASHPHARSAPTRLITPKRLSENEEFMWRLADRHLDGFVDRGSCEFLADYARPFSGLGDRGSARNSYHCPRRAPKPCTRARSWAASRDDSLTRAHNPLEWMNDKFAAFITDRRREPREDVLTELAEAKYPDGSTPEVIDVVRLATFVFAAGQETTVKLLGAALRVLAEHPDLQALLRDDRDLIPAFLEETLRMESPVKSHFRMARTSTSVSDIKVTAGSTMMLLPGACNRDERKFEEPNEFSHGPSQPCVSMLAFGRGNHSCPGAPLARAEGPDIPESDPGSDVRHSLFPRWHHGSPGRTPLHLRTHVADAWPDRAAP